MVDVSKIIEVSGSIATPLIGLIALVKAWPFLRRQAALVSDLAAKEEEARAANQRADLAQETSEAWKKRFESLDGRIDELREEFKEKLTALEHRLALSVKYICILSVWAHDSQHPNPIPMPEPPAELREDIQAGLREQPGIIRPDITEKH
ncbi:MAG: hypothetical protein KGL39_32910 [Patescibacteria group bacterium]|nr:hypothetical protein [Patescibacteria group bacterium]